MKKILIILMSCLVISAFAPPPPIGGVISPGSGSSGTNGVTTNGVLALAYAPIVLWHGVSATVQPTLTAAKTAAVVGDLIDVRFGVYNENNLLKNGVNWQFASGTYIWYYAVTNNSTGALGIFDDRGSGACTSSIYGDLNFFYSTGTNNYVFDIGATNSLGALVITNAQSSIRFDFDTGDGESYRTTDQAPAILFVINGRTNWINFKQLICSKQAATFGGNGNVISGCDWGIGDLYFTGDYVGTFPSGLYAIWPDQANAILSPTDQTNSANGYFTVGLCDGYVYNAGNSLNYKTWYDFKEIRGNANGGAGVSIAGGKVYLRAEKILNAVEYGVQSIGNAESWVTVQKMSNSGGKGWLHVSAGTVYATVQHFEDLTAGANPRIEVDVGGKLFLNGGIAGGVGSGNAVVVSGGYLESQGLSITNFGTNYNVSGGLVNVNGGLNKTTGTGGKGIVFSGGEAEFRNTTFDTSSVNNAANNPVFVNLNGMRLKGITLVAPALATAINSSSAKTVDVYWSASNAQTNANITFGVNAGYTVNSGVK